MKNKEFYDLTKLNAKEVFEKTVHCLQITYDREVVFETNLKINDNVFQKVAKWLESKCDFVQE